MDSVNDEAATVAMDPAAASSEEAVGSTCWLKLSERHQFSRLLYPNPVCFLGLENNVMVLSWLTATNNNGHFMFSLCKRRHTASMLMQDSIFTLSVPVRGMEELVKHVGGVSGRLGSKFSANHHTQPEKPASVPCTSTSSTAEQQPPLSKRQKKKIMLQGRGVPGLETVPLEIGGGNQQHLFAIEGTVARMVCKVNQILNEIIDSDHLLVLAQVDLAEVHRDYWDETKDQFRPMRAETAPYLTFFGSQRFGYVVSEDRLLDSELASLESVKQY